MALPVNGYTDVTSQGKGVFGILDTGASSVVVGHQTMLTVLTYLQTHGVDIVCIEFRPANKLFQFGGDHTGHAAWSIHLPVIIDNKSGRIQVFIVDGSTPFLVGRPILAHFGIKIDYQKDTLSYNDGPWHDAQRGSKGEYMMPMFIDGQEWSTQLWHFDLMTDDTIENVPDLRDGTVDFQSYLEQTGRSPGEVFLHADDEDIIDVSGQDMNYDEDPGAIYKPVGLKLMKSIQNQQQYQLAQQKHMIHQALAVYEKGQLQKPWQHEVLQAERDVEENTHLRFSKKVYCNQLKRKDHAILESPKPADSWKTRTFKSMDEQWYKGHLDQCAVGARLPDHDGQWLPIKKPTTLAASDPKLAELITAICPGCPCHLPLEGSSPMIGNRALAAAVYQPSMCQHLARAIHHFLMDEIYVGEEIEPEQQEQQYRGIMKRLIPKNASEVAPQEGLPPEPHGLKRSLTTHDSDASDEADNNSEYTPTEAPEEPGPAKVPRIGAEELPSSSLPMPLEHERKEGDPSGDVLPEAEKLVKKEGDPTGEIDESYKEKVGETFAEKAKRFSQQETISFGPSRSKASTESRSTPYGNKPLSDDSALTTQEISVDLLKECQLPSGWHCEDGFVVMEEVHDMWELRGNHLILNHFLPRVGTYTPTTEDCPIKQEYLTKDRDSYDGSQHHHDRWKKKGTTSTGVWTGQTRFKINACDRKAAHEQFYAVSQGQKTMAKKDEIQAACGADKRTAIETLVCQDKLRACRASVKWVSSEMQFADSLTKADSSQLLADRLRTHVTKITSDEGFQAAKKKDAHTRKKNTEMFAVKRLLKREDDPDIDDNETVVDDNLTDSGTQTEENNVSDASTMTEWDLPHFEARFRECYRQLTDLQVNNHILHEEHQALMEEHEVTVNDREALIEAFNQLKENFETVKEQRNAMKDRYIEIQRILHDVQFEREQFIKERIVTIMEQLDRQSFYFTRSGTVFHRDRAFFGMSVHARDSRKGTLFPLHRRFWQDNAAP
ncbi:unnamed protein product, partial [Durusdinium trenchii]